jgi:hypothetical protein
MCVVFYMLLVFKNYVSYPPSLRVTAAMGVMKLVVTDGS